MKLFRKRDLITTLFILIFSALVVTMFYFILKPAKTLPIYQPSEVNQLLVDSSIAHVSKYHEISDFKLTNQNGKEITQEFYKQVRVKYTGTRTYHLKVKIILAM